MISEDIIIEKSGSSQLKPSSTSTELLEATETKETILEDIRTQAATLADFRVEEFTCPITQELITDPVLTPCCPHRFERDQLREWVLFNRTCPLTRRAMRRKDIREDPDGKQLIEKYLEQIYSSSSRSA